MAKLFVYGTLKRNFSAHRLLKNAPAAFLGEIKTTPHYHLYDVGSFPGLLFDATQECGVQGELFEVPEAAFRDLDRYECVNSGLFRREKIELEDGTKAHAYLFNSDTDNAVKIESGLWE
jgi:gamma-glutamylcyclotransferase (GGCT)/AIG2-like uncharacterized protein YtfP